MTDNRPGRADAAEFVREKHRTSPSVAVIEQALAGTRLPTDSMTLPCEQCGSCLSEGSPVTVAATRSDAGAWSIEAVYGAACSPIVVGDIEESTDARPLALVEGDIGSVVDSVAQEHHAVLLDAIVIDTDIGGSD